MSGAWFSCKARESNTNIACWFPLPRLQSLDKIATKYFPTQDMLTPWHLEIRRIFGVRLGRWSRTKNMISNWHWWKYDRIYHSTRSLLGHSTSAKCLHYQRPYASTEESWGDSWVHKRSPWLVENGRGVRHWVRVREFLQSRFCTLLRRKGDSEGVRKRWRHREGLSQGRGNRSLLVKCDTRSWVLFFIWYFYVLNSSFLVPKKRLSWLVDSILRRDVIWILSVLPGLERLASKGVGRSMDIVNFLMTILPQCPCSREQKDWKLIYMYPWLNAGVILSLGNNDEEEYTSRNDSSSDNTRISSRPSTNKSYTHSNSTTTTIRQQTPSFAPAKKKTL